MMLKYPAKFTKMEDDGIYYLVEFIDFPEIVTEGDTFKEAFNNAKEALNGCLESDLDRNFTMPSPSKVVEENVYDVEVNFNIELALKLRYLRGALTQTQLAKKLGMSQQAYQKLENPAKCNPKIGTIFNIAKALGKDLDILFH
jgi:antitoxin HicB